MPFVDGLFSGLDTTSIINQLLALEQKPILKLQGRVETTTKEKTALLEISARLLALKTRASALASEDEFGVTKTTSSNTNALLASGSAVAATGSFLFQPALLATTNQFLSSGFADTNSTPVGAGTLSITVGGGHLDRDVDLADLNGGTGVSAGQLRITDKAGISAVVDIGPAVTVEDVVDRINQAGIGVTASVSGDSFVLTDGTGGAGLLKVEELGGSVAAELGILGSTAGAVLTGSDVINVSGATSLSFLNDGNGVRRASGNDFRITLRDGTILDIDLTSTTDRVSQVTDAINNHASNGGKVTAQVSADGNRLELVDHTGVAGTLSVTALGLSKAAEDLGLLGSVAGGAPDETLTGGRIVGSLSSVLVKELRGGAGSALGTISITDRSGTNALVNLTGLETLEQVTDAINASGANVQATVNAEKNGLLIRDLTGSTASNLIVTDSVGTAAADLGIDTGAGGVAASQVNGSDVRHQFISEQTRLSDLNLGKGVPPGKLEIIDANGTKVTIDLTQADDVLVEDVLEEINGALGTVNARINDRGDGILVEDISGGTQAIEIRDLSGGTIARDLRLAGVATGTGASNFIDGSQTKTLTIGATDTLETVRNAINALGLPVSATILNTGSGVNPFRLAITSSVAGGAGRILIEPGTSAFSFTETVEASDSVLLYGGGATPVRLSSGQNTYANIVDGLTVDLVGTTTSPVTVTVETDTDEILENITGFVEKFNAVVSKIDELTKFDTITNQKGLLFGDSTLRGIRGRLYHLLTDPATGLSGPFRTLTQVGISLLDDGTLVFDESRFRDALAADPAAVQDLFANDELGYGKVFEDALEFITDPADGVITRATSSRDTIIGDLKERIERMTERVNAKRIQLRREFASMEEAFMKSQSILQRLTQAFGSQGGGGGGGGSGLLGV